MALNPSNLFAAFDVIDGAQDRDISPVLEAAIYYELNLLSGGINVDFGSPVYDINHIWDEEQLNPDTVTLSASASAADVSLTLTAGHGNRAHVGDQLYSTAAGSTEIMQITATTANTVTITRSYGGTAATTIANGAVLALIRTEQEGSDIGPDRTLNPVVRNNNTHIFSCFDLQISGSQIARRMATNEYQDFLGRQLAARAIEMRINLTRAFLYSEKSATTGSDTAYRSMGGLRPFIRDNGGVVSATSEALSASVLNRDNTIVVNKGVFPDTLVIGTDLVNSLTTIDANLRRLRESDTTVGYVVQDVLLNQGNMVTVVVDSRVKAGDYFLYKKDKVRSRPMNERGMFVIAGADWVDGKKRRIMGEWTMEVRNPEAAIYGTNKT
jgi:hypothetical protein